jgi:hypothetical protein
VHRLRLADDDARVGGQPARAGEPVQQAEVPEVVGGEGDVLAVGAEPVRDVVDAGVDEHEVERRRARELGRERLDFGGDAEVGACRREPRGGVGALGRRDRRVRRLEARDRAAAGQQARAASREPPRDLEPEPARRAGDQRRPAGEVAAHAPSRVRRRQRRRWAARAARRLSMAILGRRV